MNRAPGWTAVVIGLLAGMLLAAVWLLGARYGPAVTAGHAPPETVVVRQEVPVARDTAAVRPDAGGLADQRRNAIVRATEKVAPAVVSINAIQHRTVTRSVVPRGMEFWDRFFPGMFPRRAFRQDVASLGSGVIVSDDGYILTNVHVIEDADELKITLHDGRQFSAHVVEQVPTWDLALVQFDDPPADLPVAPLAPQGEKLYIGEWAIAIGSPFGFLLADTQPTVTVGVISALNRDIKQTDSDRTFLGMIQTDAAINPGNSGGPLVNSEGEVIGINTFIFTESGGSIGLGFAVPIARGEWILDEVRRYGYFRRAYVGIGIRPIDPIIAQSLDLKDTTGFLVTDVTRDSPAWKAGLRPYDVLRKINGVVLKDVDTFNRLVYDAKVGTKLTFTAERDGKTVTGTIVLEEAPRRAAPRRGGVRG